MRKKGGGGWCCIQKVGAGEARSRGATKGFELLACHDVTSQSSFRVTRTLGPSPLREIHRVSSKAMTSSLKQELNEKGFVIVPHTLYHVLIFQRLKDF